jgi:RHS repeat-associated protein
VSLAPNDNGSVAADAVRFLGGPGGATDVAYVHSDHLGTPQAMTNANAQVLWWRDQTPFGQTVAEGGFSVSPLRFPGQYADTESVLAYNYFRDYDPVLGRYIQSDPIGLRGGLNTYGYVGGILLGSSILKVQPYPSVSAQTSLGFAFGQTRAAMATAIPSLELVKENFSAKTVMHTASISV